MDPRETLADARTMRKQIRRIEGGIGNRQEGVDIGKFRVRMGEKCGDPWNMAVVAVDGCETRQRKEKKK